jgi:ABC-2 type transport system permease protein
MHFAYEFKTGLRNPTSLLMNYLFPLAFFAMMGGVMTQINPGYKALLVPSMITFVTMTGSLLGLPAPLVEAREAGVFRSFKINGVPALSILLVPVLTTVFHALIVAAIVAVAGPTLFGGDAPREVLPFVLVTLLAAFLFGGLGALIGVVANQGRSTVLLSQAIFLPSMLLGGLMIPVTMLPESVRPIAGLLPTTHVMQALLGLAYNDGTALHPSASVAVVAAGAVLSFGLAIYLFSWDSRNSTRRGHPLLALLALAPFVVGMFLK